MYVYVWKWCARQGDTVGKAFVERTSRNRRAGWCEMLLKLIPWICTVFPRKKGTKTKREKLYRTWGDRRSTLNADCRAAGREQNGRLSTQLEISSTFILPSMNSNLEKIIFEEDNACALFVLLAASAASTKQASAPLAIFLVCQHRAATTTTEKINNKCKL